MESPERIARAVKWAPRLVAFGEFIDGYDLLCMGAALLFLGPQFHLDGPTKGWLAAVAFIGTAFGLVVFGDLADRLGRKVIFVVNLVFFVAASIASAFVTEVWQLMLTRFLIGVAVGMDIPTSQSFLSEIAPGARRGRIAGSLPNMMWLGGAIASILIALAIEPFAGGSTWRWLFGLAAIPALAVLIARQFLPESPRWLIAQGRVDEARAIMQVLGLPMPVVQQRVKREYRTLFSGGGLRRLLSVSAFFALQAFGGAVATIASPLVFSTIGLRVDQSLYFALGGFVTGLIAVMLGALVIDRVNRRRMGIYTCLGAFVCGIGMAAFGQSNTYLLAALYVTYSLIVWFGPGVLSWVWSSEVFPTELRGLGSGIAQCATRFAIALNLIFAPTLAANFGIGGRAVDEAPEPPSARRCIATRILHHHLHGRCLAGHRRRRQFVGLLAFVGELDEDRAVRERQRCLLERADRGRIAEHHAQFVERRGFFGRRDHFPFPIAGRNRHAVDRRCGRSRRVGARGRTARGKRAGQQRGRGERASRTAKPDIDCRAHHKCSTCRIASANARGASCGKLWPMPPLIVRCW
ncbi:hypothetical protein WS68_04800 [Burkholderia sp. TSV86]|nr:hypothetical protein WS68_04800 [Burkholderia sp. TSV86]